MNLADVVRGIGDPRILVAGDLILDRYVFGTMDRISPEAPIGVLRVTGEESRLGGAASVAQNLAVLGARVGLFGYVGSGSYGEEFLALADSRGIDSSGVRRVAGRPTSRKTRHIARRGAGGQQLLRVDHEEQGPFPEEEARAFTADLTGAVSEADLLVLSDYAKGVLPGPLLRVVIDTAGKAGVPVLVDPKPPGPFHRFRGATVMTPNRPEAASHVGFPLDDLEAVERAATRILEDLDLEAAILTLDKDGIYLKEGPGPGRLFPIVPREVYDVTGAGDMVIAVLAAVLATGGGTRDAVRLANVAAGLEVTHLGVVPLSREEILEALHENTAGGGKLVPMPELLELLAARRKRGERIVFTNGCFDILHAGHVRLFRAARAEGDALVVGLNSDASVRRLKGEGRPVVPLAERAETISALSLVDHVVAFDEDTPLEAVRTIRPDVLVKGEDWREKGVVGREIVEAGGGRVVLVPLAPGLSSSGLIRRVRGESS